MLDVQTQFLGIKRKIELAYGLYALGGDEERQRILESIYYAAQEGAQFCDDFRAAGVSAGEKVC